MSHSIMSAGETAFANLTCQAFSSTFPINPQKPLVLTVTCLITFYFVKQDIFQEMSWKTGHNNGEAREFFIFIFSLFDCWNSKDNDWADLCGRQLCTADLSKKESPKVLTYSNVLFISSLFKPKDIQYIVYSIGKLHKWSLFKYLYGVSSFRY